MPKEIELVNLVDKRGKIKVKDIPRPLATLYPDFHLPIVIGVLFNAEDQILVHKRSLVKKVLPGNIDHVCGAIQSHESPEEAFIREALEETGLQPVEIQSITKGVNIYNHYRYLFKAKALTQPRVKDRLEVAWAKFMPLDELIAGRDSGVFTFVNGYFEDLEQARNSFLLTKLD